MENKNSARKNEEQLPQKSSRNLSTGNAGAGHQRKKSEALNLNDRTFTEYSTTDCSSSRVMQHVQGLSSRLKQPTSMMKSLDNR